jgi:hypothetical protein
MEVLMYSKEELTTMIRAAADAGVTLELDREGDPIIVSREVVRTIGLSGFTQFEYDPGSGPVRVFVPEPLPDASNM